MTLAEIYALLKQTGYPVAYHHFESSPTNPAPTPPYIIYLTPYSTNFGPDNKKAMIVNKRLQVELYTSIKDIAAENKLESVLSNANIQYDKTEGYIESEKLYQIIYEFNLIEKV